MFKDTVDLITIQNVKNSNGFLQNTVPPIKRTIFAYKKSVRQSEFYAAKAIGINLEIAFDIRLGEYNNETLLEYEGKQYKIVRTYAKDSEIIELTCTSAKGD